MTVSTLNDFIATIKKEGLARQNRFTVDIADNTNRIVQLFCEQAVLPSLSLASAATKSYGESREVVYDRNFESITLSFLVDTDMQVKTYFDKWIDKIVDPMTRNHQYYESYIKNIVITVQDTKDNDTYKVVLYEAYPKNISAVTLDYNAKDVMKIQVTFNYKYHINYQLSTSRGEPKIKGIFRFDLPDPYKLSRSVGDYLRGSVSNVPASTDLYFSNFNQYQENLNDSLSITNALERQSFVTGTGSILG